MTAHDAVMQKQYFLLLSSVKSEKTNPMKAEVTLNLSSAIWSDVSSTWHTWLQATEMDTCCPTSNCDPLRVNNLLYSPDKSNSSHTEVFYLEKS